MIFGVDVGAIIIEIICRAIIGAASWLFNLYYFVVSHVTSSDIIGNSFHTIFSNELVWNLVSGVHESVVIPIAESILALFMLIQLVKISQRIDATATLPAVKDIVFLAVAYVLFHWLIVNSLDILTAVYDLFNEIVTSPELSGGSITNMGAFTLDVDGIDYSEASVGGSIALLLMALLSSVVGLIAYVVSIVVALARGVQLYVMAAFSPIPLSLLGFDETRQAGISFLKNFCAACLAGAIMVFLFAAYPMILTSMTVSVGDAESLMSLAMGGDAISVTGVVDEALEAMFSPVIHILTFIGCSILLVFGLVKSGAWAKEILGN